MPGSAKGKERGWNITTGRAVGQRIMQGY